MSIQIQAGQDLLEFIHNSPTPYHTVDNLKTELKKNGFTELLLTEPWSLKKGMKYYTTRNDSSLFTFTTGGGEPEKDGCRIIATHSDSPCFKIKPTPDITVNNHFIKINTEVYGSPILMSWLDRPLAFAGRVSLKSNNPLQPETRLVRFKRPLTIIPSLAIHLNRKVNEGIELNKQKDMLPLLGTISETLEKDNFLLKLLARKLATTADQILDFDLNLYEVDKGCIIGANNEFISSSRLDDLAMVHAGFKSMVNAPPNNAMQILCVFDNEEVGSVTKQGAGSPIFRHILERIIDKLGKGNESFFRTIYNSFMISADMAHSVHPNHQEKHDPVLQPIINNGPVIKVNANQKYTTDGDSAAIFESLCIEANVPFQRFVNRSDMAGGSTLGNIACSQLDIKTVDVGNPMLSMHSIRELAGIKDHDYMIKVFDQFFKL